MASAHDSARGVPGTRLSPIASAPARIAARSPSASVTPQIFTNGAPRDVGRIGRVRDPRRRRSGRRRPGPRRGRELRRRGRVEPDAHASGDGRGVADAGLGDDEAIVRDERAEADRPFRIDVERPKVAVVQPDDPGVGRERALELFLVVRLDKWLEADLQGTVDEAGEALRRMEHSKEQDEIRAGRAKMRQLDRLDDELLGEDRDRDRRPDRSEVVDRAAEPVGLAQDGDRRRAARLVGSSPGDDVLVGAGDRARPTGSAA